LKKISQNMKDLLDGLAYQNSGDNLSTSEKFRVLNDKPELKVRAKLEAKQNVIPMMPLKAKLISLLF